MPVYTAPLVVSAGTTKDKPATTKLSVEECTIIRFDVYFPPGCHNLVHVAVFYGSEQIAPKPAGSSFVGNGETISWPEEYRCPEVPCPITFVGWAPTTRYDHSVVCRIVTRPIEVEDLERKTAEGQNLIIRFLKSVVGVR